MKKSIFILAALLLASQNLFSQEQEQEQLQEQKQEKERKVTIQVNPLLWFIDIVSFGDDNVLLAMDLESQFKITNSVNISVELSFLLSDSSYEDYYYENITFEKIYQINLKPMFIYRPFQTGLNGFYLGFHPNIGFLIVENDDINQFYTELGFGIAMGYKWIFKGGFTIQIGGGISKSFRIPNDSKQYLLVNSDGSISTKYTDIQILSFKMGYSF